MFEWGLLPLKRYVDFSGRSRRKEYWFFALFSLILYFVVGLIFGARVTEVDPVNPAGGILGSLALPLVALVLFLPSLGVTVRRFHDQDKSGWLVLLGLIPFVGGLIVMVMMCLEGTRGPNRYGPDPKEARAAQ